MSVPKDNAKERYSADEHVSGQYRGTSLRTKQPPYMFLENADDHASEKKRAKCASGKRDEGVWTVQEDRASGQRR